MYLPYRLICTHSLAYPDPGPVVGLTCPSLGSADALNITWSPPTDGGDVTVGYQVEVTRYVPGEGRQVTTVDLSEPFNKEITPSRTVVTGLGELCTLIGNALLVCIVCIIY